MLMSARSYQAVIDRLEGEWAVLLVEGEGVRLNVPRQLLPAEWREGDWLRLTLTREENTTQEHHTRVRELMEDLQPREGDFEV